MAERTEINKLGKFGLIKHLMKDLVPKNESTYINNNDDSLVIKTNKETLVSSKLLLEGINFDLVYYPLKHLGYKSAVVGFSDIYAMNANPKQLSIVLGLSARFCVEDLDEYFSGVKLACELYNVDLVNIDTNSSMTGLTINVTCIGEAEKDKIVRRNGAKENDLICCTGDFGAAYMGLQLLEREKISFNKNKEKIEDHFLGKEYLLEKELKPEAQQKMINDLASNEILPTSMINGVNGLASDILQICVNSNCGCKLFEEKLPIDYQTATACEEMNLNLTTIALNGGDDYELLFTIPLEKFNDAAKIENIRIIGHICKKIDGRKIITRDGNEFDLIAQGWNEETLK